MGQKWDGGDIAFRPETWRAVYDCLLPGAYLLAFGSTRGSHRMTCAIEDAGFEIRDTISHLHDGGLDGPLLWVYGSGFPKSHNISVAIDKAAGAVRKVVGVHERSDLRKGKAGFRNLDGDNEARGAIELTAPATPEAVRWQGWGSSLKPAYEPVIVARKPLEGTIAGNVLKHGCGGLNIDASRVGTETITQMRTAQKGWREAEGRTDIPASADNSTTTTEGRWPSNVIIDDSQQVADAFAAFGERPGAVSNGRKQDKAVTCYGDRGPMPQTPGFGDTGTAARFFFCAKADANDRAGSKHPCVKPSSLMRYLITLVCPPGGTVLDPFAGSGSTLLAADQLGFNAVGIEMDPTYAEDARRKVTRDAGMFAEVETNAVQEALL